MTVEFIWNVENQKKKKFISIRIVLKSGAYVPRSFNFKTVGKFHGIFEYVWG